MPWYYFAAIAIEVVLAIRHQVEHESLKRKIKRLEKR